MSKYNSKSWNGKLHKKKNKRKIYFIKSPGRSYKDHCQRGIYYYGNTLLNGHFDQTIGRQMDFQNCQRPFLNMDLYCMNLHDC